MWLTMLTVDVGDDPNKPRPGRNWLKNVYRVHQRLSMAFPKPERKESDEKFLNPASPPDFPDWVFEARDSDESAINDIHQQRDEKRGFLFRIEADTRPLDKRAGRKDHPFPPGKIRPVRILVQSAASKRPEWEWAFQNAPFLIPEKGIVAKDVSAAYAGIQKGLRFKFRLLANPTKKEVAGKDIGKRVPLNDYASHTAWIERKASAGGFQLDCYEIINQGVVRAWKGHEDPKGQRGMMIDSFLFEGELTVIDEIEFRRTLVAGIGSGKAFGFGLLSVARL